MSLQEVIDSALAQTPPGRTVWVALSGGLDSSLLLTLAAEACRRHPRPLRALHVHHGLQAAADGFERHCRRLCSQLDVALTVERVAVDLAAGRGLEGAAREARYAAFARHVAPGETLWLAQHRDDQAESFLLAALRGSGVRGLAGMPSRRVWRGRALVRPLLATPRSALEAEALRLGLSWVEDPTNADEALDRNFLRASLLPRLEERWPHAGATLARSAELAGEAEALLGELAELDLARLGGEPSRLAAAPLGALSPPRQRLLLRHACQRLGLPTPPAARLATLLAQLGTRADGEVRVAWPGAEARIWRETLYLMAPLQVLPADWRQRWDGTAPLTTPLGVCAVRLSGPMAPAPQGPASGSLTLQPRRGGERLRLARRGSRDLKRLLQELDVPPWRRRQLLVVWHRTGESDAATAVALLDPLAERWLALAEGWQGHERSMTSREKPAAC